MLGQYAVKKPVGTSPDTKPVEKAIPPKKAAVEHVGVILSDGQVATPSLSLWTLALLLQWQLIKFQQAMPCIAMVFAFMALADTMVDLIFYDNLVPPKNMSQNVETNADELTVLFIGTVRFIPLALAIVIQIFQAATLFVHFMMVQTGFYNHDTNHFVILGLMYPVFTAIVIFIVFPYYFIYAPLLTAKIVVVCAYQIWLLITVDLPLQ